MGHIPQNSALASGESALFKLRPQLVTHARPIYANFRSIGAAAAGSRPTRVAWKVEIPGNVRECEN
jgi:hypothetical protein